MSSPYYLAIDVRREVITAAVAEGSKRDAISTRGVRLEPSGPGMPAVVHIGPEEIAFGGEAVSRGDADPGGVIRDFVSGIGRPDAVAVVDGKEFAAADLYAWIVDNVLQRVAETRGAAPAGVWVVVPSSWGDAEIDEIADAFDRDGQREVEFVAAPVALASRYSASQPSNPDLTLIVCDVDDSALQAAIVRQVPGTRSRRIGAPVDAPISSDAAQDTLDERAIDTVVQALAATGVAIDAVDAIVLSGPSDRLEHFRRLLVDRFGEPIDTDPDPRVAAAAGAALALARRQLAAATPVAPAAPVARAAAAGAAAAVGVGVGVASSAGAPSAKPASAPPAATAPPWYRRPARLVGIGVGAAAVAVTVAVAGAFAIGGIEPAGSEAESPASEVTDAGPTNEPSATGASPSATSLPTSAPDAAAPPSAPDPVASESPGVRVNPRIPSAAAPRTPIPSAPPVAAPANPQAPAAPQVPPAAPPAPAPTPPVDPGPSLEPTSPPADPSPSPQPPSTPPTPPADPSPSPDPTSSEPVPSLPPETPVPDTP